MLEVPRARDRVHGPDGLPALAPTGTGWLMVTEEWLEDQPAPIVRIL